MITSDMIKSCEKEKLSDLIPSVDGNDIRQVVAWLEEIDDNFRYKCFLLLQTISQRSVDVYPYWDVFVGKLDSTNSYQRSLGLMLIAENVRWDTTNRFDAIADRYLSFCDDEKPVTVRQCIQSLLKIIPFNNNCFKIIVDKLLSIDLMQRKDTQRKILLVDIISVLSAIQLLQPDPRINLYLQQAMTGGILDNQSKKLIAAKVSRS